MTRDDLEGSKNARQPEARLWQKRPDVVHVKPPELPGGGKLLLWLGLGCGTFLVIVGIPVGLGIYGLASIVKTTNLDKLFAGPAPVLPYGEGPGEVFDPEKMPEPPLVVAEPPAPSTRLKNSGLTIVVRGVRMQNPDLATLDGQTLLQMAEVFYRRGDYQSAIQCQHAAIIKTGVGRYNLACFYTRAGEIEAALYWLQLSATEDSTDAVWANQDEDLARIRQDPRWPALLDYLRAYQRYWSVIREPARSSPDARESATTTRRAPEEVH